MKKISTSSYVRGQESSAAVNLNVIGGFQSKQAFDMISGGQKYEGTQSEEKTKIDITENETHFYEVYKLNSGQNPEFQTYTFEWDMPGWVDTNDIYLELNYNLNIWSSPANNPIDVVNGLLGNVWIGPEYAMTHMIRRANLKVNGRTVNFKDGDDKSYIKAVQYDSKGGPLEDILMGRLGLHTSIDRLGQLYNVGEKQSGPAMLTSYNQRQAWNNTLRSSKSTGTNITIAGTQFTKYISPLSITVPFRYLFYLFKQRRNLPPGLKTAVAIDIENYSYIGFIPGVAGQPGANNTYFGLQFNYDPRIGMRYKILSNATERMINEIRLTKQMIYPYEWLDLITIPMNNSRLYETDIITSDITPLSIYIKHIWTGPNSVFNDSSTELPALVRFQNCLTNRTQTGATSIDTSNTANIEEIQIVANGVVRYNYKNNQAQSENLNFSTNVYDALGASLNNESYQSYIGGESSSSVLGTVMGFSSPMINRVMEFTVTNLGASESNTLPMNSRMSKITLKLLYSNPLPNLVAIRVFVKRNAYMTVSSDNQVTISNGPAFPTSNGFEVLSLIPS